MSLFMSHVPKIVEVGAYLGLLHTARKGQVSGVSHQTLAGLSISATLSFLNSNPYHWWETTFYTLVVVVAGWACFFNIREKGDTKSEEDGDAEDDLLIGDQWRMPRWAKKSAIFWTAALMTAVVSIAACRFSLLDLAQWFRRQPTGILCTFQNFLHGTAMLPQLLLSRRRGVVAPAAAQFLLILGIKHLLELAVDLTVSYWHFWNGTLVMHEASYLSGDLFAAAVLLDFLYLFAVSQTKLPVWIGAASLSLDVV